MRVICTMCGRDNPSHLVFCQECGQRLAPRASPATPSPEAMPVTSPLAATAASPIANPEALPPPPLALPPPSSPAPGKARPAAPAVSFTKRGELQPPPEPPLPLERTSVTAWPTTPCTLCGTPNQRGQRFCIGCGQPLATDQDERADRIGPIELMRTIVDAPRAEPPPTSAVASPVPIAPARVIDVGPSTPRGGERSCPRCRGPCDPGAQFCRFCGLALAAPVPAGTAAMPSSRLSPAPTTAPSAIPAFVPTAPSRAVAPPPPVVAAVRSGPVGARLVVITREGTEGARHPLGSLGTLGDSVDLGRREGDILFSDDEYVSPRHARIVVRGGGFFLRDLESTNGVYVRIPFSGAIADEDAGGKDDSTVRGHHAEPLAEPRLEQPLADIELFLVGQQVLRFEVVKQAEEGFGAASENGTLLFGTPAAPRYARLSQRTVEGVMRDVFHLRKAETIIGRESGDIVFTDDPFLSRRHAAIRILGGGASPRRFTLSDLGSSNGTFLRIQEEIRLNHGDHFRIGQQLLRFDIDAGRAGV